MSLAWAYSSKSFTPDNWSLSGHLHILLLKVKVAKKKIWRVLTQDMTEMTERKQHENEK